MQKAREYTIDTSIEAAFDELILDGKSHCGILIGVVRITTFLPRALGWALGYTCRRRRVAS